MTTGAVPARPVSARHPLHPTVLVAVGVGGAVGAMARYGAHVWVPQDGGRFPLTTFAVNLTGVFLLAILPAFGAIRRRPLLPPALGTGVLGGYTTLSAYSEQTRRLLADGHLLTATAYVFGTLTACLAAVALADRFSTRRDRAEFEDEEGDL